MLLQRLASELVFIDTNEDLAKAEAEDISHVAGFLGNPKIVGTKGTQIFDRYFEKWLYCIYNHFLQNC